MVTKTIPNRVNRSLRGGHFAIDTIMLGHCMLLVIASDMVNQISIPGLMKCIASDYVESRSRKRHLLLRAFFTLLSILRNSQTGYWRPTVSPPSRFPSPRMHRIPLYSL